MVRMKNFLLIFGVVVSITGLAFTFYPTRMENRLGTNLLAIGDCAFFLGIMILMLSPLILLKDEGRGADQEEESSKRAAAAAESGYSEEEMMDMALEGCIRHEWKECLSILGVFSSACALLLLLCLRPVPGAETVGILGDFRFGSPKGCGRGFPAIIGAMVSIAGLLILIAFLFVRTPAQRWRIRNFLYALLALADLAGLAFFAANERPLLFAKQEPAAKPIRQQSSFVFETILPNQQCHYLGVQQRW